MHCHVDHEKQDVVHSVMQSAGNSSTATGSKPFPLLYAAGPLLEGRKSVPATCDTSVKNELVSKRFSRSVKLSRKYQWNSGAIDSGECAQARLILFGAN